MGCRCERRGTFGSHEKLGVRGDEMRRAPDPRRDIAWRDSVRVEHIWPVSYTDSVFSCAIVGRIVMRWRKFNNILSIKFHSMDGRFRTAVAALGLLYALCSHCSIAQPNDVTSTNDYDNQQATDIPPTNSPDVEESHDSTGILEKGENPCHSAPDPGPCSAELVRFFYDVKSNQCRQFIFGGCQGNGNRFITENDCK